MRGVSRSRTIRGVMAAALCVAGVSGGNAWAESRGKADPVQSLDPVVVTATKTPIPLSHVTSAVEVLTEADLHKQKFKTVADALRLSPGLAVFSNGGAGTETTVRMRGASHLQTLVLIDGAIVNSATQGFYSFANLTTDHIERIEILRGPQSMLWGADAMGGVINITTKQGRGPLHASAFAEYGSFQTIREGGRVSGRKGPVDVALALSRWDATGFSTANYRRGATERDAFRNWQGSSKVGVALPRDGRLEFAFRWLNSDVHLDNISTPRDVFGSKTREQEMMYAARYDQRLTDWWTQTLTLARAEDQSLFDSGKFQKNLVTGAFSAVTTAPNETRTLSTRIEAQENVQVGKPLRLVAGYQLRDQQGENDTGLSNRTVKSHAGFADAQLNVRDRVFATAGVRHDRYNVFGEATTYRATAGYLVKETDTKLRGSYATGFRAPAINQLFFPNFGNPTLQSEKSRGFDVGVEQRLFGDRVQLSGGYFWNRFRDLIVNVSSDPACAPFSTLLSCPRNISNAVTKGWEASAAFALVRDHPFAQSLELRGHYTNTLTRNVSDALRLPRWPVDQWSAVLSYQPIDPVVVNLAVRYMGSRLNDALNRQPQRAFDVWSFSASYDVTTRVQAYTRVENLFDEKYEEILNTGTAGRSIYVGVQVSYDAK